MVTSDNHLHGDEDQWKALCETRFCLSVSSSINRLKLIHLVGWAMYGSSTCLHILAALILVYTLLLLMMMKLESKKALLLAYYHLIIAWIPEMLRY